MRRRRTTMSRGTAQPDATLLELQDVPIAPLLNTSLRKQQIVLLRHGSFSRQTRTPLRLAILTAPPKMFRHSAVKCTRSIGKTSQQGLPPPFHSNTRHERSLCQGLDQDASHGAISWVSHKSLLNGCSACNHPTCASTPWEATCAIQWRRARLAKVKAIPSAKTVQL